MEYFTGKGRIGRLRYLGTGLVLGFAFFVVLLVGITLEGDSERFPTLAIIAMPFLYWMSFASAVRRCHDLGLSGWMVLLMLIPLVGAIFGLYLLFAAGDSGHNRYGPPFGLQAQLSLADHRIQAAEIRAEAARAYTARQQ